MKIFCLQYMNNENIKMFVCNKQIMKKWKYLSKIHELWKNENVSSQCMNYEIKKMFVCNIWMMKTFKCLFTIWILKIFVCNKLWKK